MPPSVLGIVPNLRQLRLFVHPFALFLFHFTVQHISRDMTILSLRYMPIQMHSSCYFSTNITDIVMIPLVEVDRICKLFYTFLALISINFFSKLCDAIVFLFSLVGAIQYWSGVVNAVDDVCTYSLFTFKCS